MTFEKAMNEFKFYGSADIVIIDNELYVVDTNRIVGKLKELVKEWNNHEKVNT
jgi:hypothetical protein